VATSEAPVTSQTQAIPLGAARVTSDRRLATVAPLVGFSVIDPAHP